MKIFKSRGKRQHIKLVVADYNDNDKNALQDRVYLSIIGNMWWITITTAIKVGIAFNTLDKGFNVEEDIELLEEEVINKTI